MIEAGDNGDEGYRKCHRDSDNTDIYWSAARDAVVFFHRTINNIGTFFKPTDGEAYFNRKINDANDPCDEVT